MERREKAAHQAFRGLVVGQALHGDDMATGGKGDITLFVTKRRERYRCLVA
jgi:hypothetical protein